MKGELHNALISEVHVALWPKNAWEGRPGSRYSTYRSYLESFRRDRLSEAGSQAADEGQTAEKEAEPKPKEKTIKERMMEQCQAHYKKHQDMTMAAQNAAQVPKGSMPAPPPKPPQGSDVGGGASRPPGCPPYKTPPPTKPASPQMPPIQEEKTEGTEGEPDNKKEEPDKETKEEEGEYGGWGGKWGSWNQAASTAGWPQQNSWQNWRLHQVAWLGDMN